MRKAKRREDIETPERKYSLAGSRPRGGRGGGSGIPAGSRAGGGAGGGSGIPAGSRAGGGRGGGSGIPAGSRAGGGARGGSGIPSGSSVRNRKRRGGSGVPAGSKSEDKVLMESKAQPVSAVGKIEDDERGVCEAYVSVTGVEDAVGDIIEPGAYEKTLKARTPRGVWSHAWSSPVSKTLAIKEIMPGDSSLPDTLSNGEPWPVEAGALWVKTQFNLNTPAGRDAYENVKFFSEGTGNDTAEWSIGYKTTKSSKDKKGVRRIKELDLYEYSPVLHGANRHAKTLSVKSFDEAIEALHMGGYDTSELDVKTGGEPFDGLTRAEIKAIPLAIDILSAYADELGLKRAAPVGDPDLEDPGPDERWIDSDTGTGTDAGVERLLSLSERLEQVMVADDYPELLQAADAFDRAVQAGDDDAIADTVQGFLEVFEAEEADDPDDPDSWDGLRDVVADCLDDANELLYGIVPDDDDELDEDGGEGAPEDGDEFAEDEDAYVDADADMPGGSGEEAGSDGDTEPADSDVGKSGRRGEVKGPSQAERDKAANAGAAMNDGSFPIRNASELQKAWNLRNNGNKPSSAVVAHIRKRAKALGLPMPGSDSGSSSSSSSGKSDGSFVLPDMGWADAAFKAIDFGDVNV